MPAAFLVAGCGAAAASPHASSADAAQSSSGWQGLGYSPTSAPSPSAAGTYQGACDHTLDSNWSGYDAAATATGDIEVHNTGNVGVVHWLRITWPQEGYNPLVMRRMIRLRAGASRDVEFHMPLREPRSVTCRTGSPGTTTPAAARTGRRWWPRSTQRRADIDHVR